jgi:hypothetical protein
LNRASRRDDPVSKFHRDQPFGIARSFPHVVALAEKPCFKASAHGRARFHLWNVVHRSWLWRKQFESEHPEHYSTAIANQGITFAGHSPVKPGRTAAIYRDRPGNQQLRSYLACLGRFHLEQWDLHCADGNQRRANFHHGYKRSRFRATSHQHNHNADCCAAEYFDFIAGRGNCEYALWGEPFG